MDNAFINVMFMHPTTDQVMEAEVDPNITVDRVIHELLAIDFISDFPYYDGYTLLIKDTNRHIRGSQTLAEGGIRDGSRIHVVPSYLTAEGGTGMAIIPAIHWLRLENEYHQMGSLLDGSGIITWEATKGTPPCVEEYEITINVRTIVGLQEDTPIYRDSSVVRITLPSNYPVSCPVARMLSTPPPFHPHWYTSGRWDGGYWERSEFLVDYVIRLTGTLQFSPKFINENSPSNPDAARWYIAHKDSGLFPCDQKTLPDPSERKRGPNAGRGFRILQRE